MKKLLSMITIVCLTLSGCATASNTSEFAGACDEGDVKIGFITDAGGIDDKSFNQGTWEGIEEFCAATGIGATYVETTDSSQLKSNLTQLSETDGIEIVVGSGFVFASDMYDVASTHPDTNYVLIDAEPTNPETGNVEALDNVVSYLFNEQEAGYLVGYVAGLATEGDRVGFIGGQEIPPVQRFGYGFVQGVNDANPKATVDFQYAGTFSDATIGNTIAQTMINQGTDIIFVSAGNTNDGILKAATDSTLNGTPVSIIGVDRDMYEDGLYTSEDGTQKSVVLTSAMKLVNHAAYEGLDAHFNGQFKGGETITLGLSENAVGLPAENPNLDTDVVEQANEALSTKDDLSVDGEEISNNITIAINGNL